MIALDDALHKLEWGSKHLAELYVRLKAVFNPDSIHHDIKSYLYPKPSGVTDLRPWWAFTVFFSVIPLVDKEDGLLLGEVIQSFRSCLDYLAWVWVTNQSGMTLSERQKRSILFPMITTNSNDFWKNVKKFLPNVSHEKLAFIESYQPYQISDIGRAMSYLHILSNTDKHRIIVPTLVWPLGIELGFRYSPIEVQEVKRINLMRSGDIEKGTEIVTVVLAYNTQPKVEVNASTTIMPMFSGNVIKPTPPDTVLLIEPTLNRIGEVCREILTKAQDNL